ncbi:hypothetical protein SDC9_190569 [bioreactor metagenome]|uniref:Uncharacterized protein n=1 Tax=bioreactor metagenome TaxID=1076179 RepID=A0A645HVX5_9ZZZZ
MVFISFNQSFHTILMSRCPLGKISRMHALVEPTLKFSSHSVGFNVGFITNQQTILIAQLVPQRTLGIMAHAHGIHIETFHHAYVFQHGFFIHIMACILIMFVQIHSTNQQRLTVEHQLSIFYLHLSETCFAGSCFNNPSALIFQRKQNRIKHRSFITP